MSLAALALLKRLGGAVWSWLTHASFWQLVALVLAALAIVQHFQLADARHDAVNYRRQRDGYRATLDTISAKKNAQKAETTERIRIVKEQVRHADSIAKQIEQSPLEGQCKTPSAIMGADL